MYVKLFCFLQLVIIYKILILDTSSDDDIFEIDRETRGGIQKPRHPSGRSGRKSSGGSW